MKKLLASAIAVVMLSSVAQAATVQSLATAPGAWTGLTATSVVLPTGANWVGTAPAERTGNVSSIYRSPFDPTGGTLVGWETIPYFAVGPGNNTTAATLGFDKLQTSMTFLWGSPDTHNAIEFFNGSTSSFLLGTSALVPATGAGAALVKVSGLLFDRVQFRSTSNALEFSNITASPVPLPAAGWMLIAGLGALAAAARRRRAA